MSSSGARLVLPQTPLFQRITFVIIALLVYRLGTFIPLASIDYDYLAQMRSTVDSLWFVSSVVQRLSIFSLGIWPYIWASIIVLCSVWFVPSFAAMLKTQTGRLRFNEIIRWLTAIIAGFQGYNLACDLEQMTWGVNPIVFEPGFTFQLQIAITCASASLFLVWLAEKITERGLGNGVLFFLFVDIVVQLRGSLAAVLELARQGTLQSKQAFFSTALILAAIVGVVFIEKARRRFLVERPDAAYGGAQAHVSLHLNPSGLVPLFIAPVLSAMPIGFAYLVAPVWFEATGKYIFGVGSPGYIAITAVLIVLFTMIFRTFCGSDPAAIANRIEISRALIPSIAPGASTVAHITEIHTRIAVLGAFYLAVVGLLPSLMTYVGIYAGIAYSFGDWSLLVMVIVPLTFLAGVRGTPHGKV